MGRIELLDGLRGWCLVFMMLTHLHLQDDYLLGYLHFNQLVFADSAQAFIFLSGLLVGLIGVRQHARQGAMPVVRRFWRRAAELYGWHLGLLLLILLMASIIPLGWFAWREWLQHLLVQRGPYVGATAALIYQPTLLDILPQYILYLLAAPALIHLVARGRAGLVLAASLGLWLLVQLGLGGPPASALAGLGWLAGQPVVARAAFNPLAWQLLFVGGLVLGGLRARGDLPTPSLLTSRRRQLADLVPALLLVMMALRLSLPYWPEDGVLIGGLRALADREALGLLRVLSFAGLAYLLARLLYLASEDGPLRRLVGHPWPSLIGRHALPVFAFHVVLIYLLRLLSTLLGGIPDPWYSLLALAAIATLLLPAKLADAWQARGAAVRPARA